MNIPLLLRGRYQIEGPLGSGGQGKVWAANDQRIAGKRWAIKQIPLPTGPSTQSLRYRYDLEKWILSLGIPHVPRLNEGFEEGSFLYLVMDLVEGDPLHKLQGRTNPLPEARVLDWARQAATVLDTLHGRNEPLVYGDMNPKNLILRRDGRLFLVDFGAARLMAPRHPATGQRLGTPGFAAPEQAAGTALSPATDLFGFAATFYFLLTGRHLEPGTDVRASLKGLRPDVSPFWGAVLASAGHVEAARRGTAAQLLAALGSVGNTPCPSCKALNQKSARFCARCGTTVSSSAGTPSLTAAPHPAQPPAGGQREATPVLTGPRLLPTTRVKLGKAEESRVLKKLLKGEFDELSWVQLREAAERVSEINGFTDLLTVGQLNIDTYSHQHDVVRRVLREMRGNAILSDEVGLGKTIEAGIVLKELHVRGLINRVLIIVPPNLLYQWQEELETKFDLPFQVLRQGGTWDSPFLICSHAQLRNTSNRSDALAVEHDLVIVDEAHLLLKKDATPGVVYETIDRTKRKYLLLLSATPLRRHIVELYYLVNLVRPGQFPRRNDFLAQFQDPQDPRRARNKQKLAGFLKDVMTRTHRRTTGIKWPSKRVVPMPVAPGTQERTALSQLTEVVRKYRTDGFRAKPGLLAVESSVAAGAAQLSRWGVIPSTAAYDACSNLEHCAKSQTLIRILQQERDRVLVFTSQAETQRLIARHISHMGRPVFLYQGDRRKKYETVRAFVKTPGSILVANETASEGRNLQICSAVVNYDIPWNPTQLEQRIGRIYRIGQASPEVRIYNLFFRDSLEEALYRLYAEKLRMFDLVIGEVDMVLDELDDGVTFDEFVWKLWSRSVGQGELVRDLDRLGVTLAAARREYEAEKTGEAELNDIFGLGV